jgi:flagellar hook protein FlgE
MDVVGNNIANINTIGYKSGRITFADTISEMLRAGSGPRENRAGINPVQVGLGMKAQSVDIDFGQGSLEATGYATDIAIQGKGMFVVRVADKTMYTRAGNFTIDADGRLVAAGGLGIVQGRVADNGVIQNEITDIVIPTQQKIPAKSTENITLYSNLDSNATLADATLDDEGTNGTGATLSGVTSVDGIAEDGIGGVHSITIEGSNATQSSEDSNSNGLDFLDRLGPDLGVTGEADGSITLEITIDGDITDPSSTTMGTKYNIEGLTVNSTVAQLISALNDQVPGAEFELDSGTGAISVTRSFYGDGASYNVLMRDSGTASDVVATLFSRAAVDPTADTFVSDSGTASTLTATDTFTDSSGNSPVVAALSFVQDPNNGLDTELTGLGGGGVTILANGGFDNTVSEGTGPGGTDEDFALVINTADTSHSTSINVYDEQGNTHLMTLEFTKTSVNNTWTWEASVPEPALAAQGNTGAVVFNSDGTLKAWTDDDNVGRFIFDPNTGENVEIVIDPGTLGGMDGITQTSSSFTTTISNQDGYGMGILENIDIDSNGQIVGNFSNGLDMTLAEIVLADFTNENGLQKGGDNFWEATDAAGDPLLGLAEDTFGSTLNTGYLEMSNVDLTKEFTEMIIAQRGFQANSRVITVSDQILQEVTNLKR